MDRRPPTPPPPAPLDYRGPSPARRRRQSWNRFILGVLGGFGISFPLWFIFGNIHTDFSTSVVGVVAIKGVIAASLIIPRHLRPAGLGVLVSMPLVALVFVGAIFIICGPIKF